MEPQGEMCLLCSALYRHNLARLASGNARNQGLTPEKIA